MKSVWVQFLSGFVFVMLAGGGIYTNGYYFDREAGGENALATTYLDGRSGGETFDDAVCAAGSEVTREMQFANVGALPFIYDTEIENIVGGGCDRLVATIFLNDVEVYSGPLAGFVHTDVPLEPASADTWRLSLQYPENVFPGDPTCTFDTEFQAYQEEFMSGQAFFDTEVLAHSVVIEPTSITVSNYSTSSVTNTVVVSSSTGGGSENGGDGEAGEEGEDADGGSGGDGGAGGAGGSGGTSTTSTSTTNVTIINEENTSSTTIESDCDCGGVVTESATSTDPT